jgi:hypothetical protein
MAWVPQESSPQPFAPTRDPYTPTGKLTHPLGSGREVRAGGMDIPRGTCLVRKYPAQKVSSALHELNLFVSEFFFLRGDPGEDLPVWSALLQLAPRANLGLRRFSDEGS